MSGRTRWHVMASASLLVTATVLGLVRLWVSYPEGRGELVAGMLLGGLLHLSPLSPWRK